MDQQILLTELTFLLVWLTAPAQIVMLVVLLLLGTVRGVFARPFRRRSVLALIVAYVAALALAIPVTLLLPRALLPPSLLPERWPSLPPLGFTPAWIACFATALCAWFLMRRWLRLLPPKPPPESTAGFDVL